MILLPASALLLRLTGLRGCQRLFSHFITTKTALNLQYSEAALSRAVRTNHLVSLAVRHGLCNANCLQRSLVLWWLLRRLGIQSSLHFGTRKEAGQFEAHAWIEFGGVVLNDSDEVRREYSTFDRPITL
jgi:hypothetical protein